MGKLISWIVLVLCVVVVPFGSWYYLKKGLDYRKQAISELLVKDSLTVRDDSLSVFLGKTSVLVLNKGTEITKNLEAINEQFKKTEGFQIVCLDSTSTFVVMPKDYLTGFLKKYSGKDFILIDQNNKIRNAYSNNVEEIKKMIEHIAITIPRPKEADIKMKQ